MKAIIQEHTGADALGIRSREDEGVIPIVRGAAERSDAAIPRELWLRPRRAFAISNGQRDYTGQARSHQLDSTSLIQMRNTLQIIHKNSGTNHMHGQEASQQIYMLAAIPVPFTAEELTEEELRLWYYLAPFAVDRLRISYDLEEVHANFSDYLPAFDTLIEALVAENILAYLSNGELAPTKRALDENILLFAKPSEVGDSNSFDEHVSYFTLPGILWLLREFGSEPRPYHHMSHPGEVLALYMRGLKPDDQQ